jgi:hypothetical protein
MLQNFPTQNEEEDRKLMQDYRNTFTSPTGKKVLCHMLTELGFFDQVLETEEEKARADYAKRLLMLCGIFLPGNLESVIDNLFRIPIMKG